MGGADSVSTKEMESEDSWTYNFLQQWFWVWQSTSWLPPPPHFAQPSHINPVHKQSSHANPVPARSSDINPVRARSSQVNPALANWHSIESATCHTSKTPKLVFNPETEQCFCLNNQLILTLILYVLSRQTPVIRLEPHLWNSGALSTEPFDPHSILLIFYLLYL